MTPFLDALDDRVLVCDGAMGTLLYAQGVFINRCFDALNLTDPDRVAAVHEDYVRAGADVVETNTFGANRIKLQAFGLADQIQDINVAGARLARNGAGERAYVAGAMGPLGLRIEPWGKTASDEAEAYFREQAQALVEGGVDLLMLETFRDVNEIDGGDRGGAERLRAARRGADDDRGRRQQPRWHAAGAVRAGAAGGRGRCHRHQLQHRAGPHARGAGADGRADVGASVRAAQRRPAARHRRPHALSDLARIHGVVRQAIPRRSRPARRRLLRDHARAHQPDQGGGQRRRADEGPEPSGERPRRAHPWSRRSIDRRNRIWPTRWRAAAGSRSSSCVPPRGHAGDESIEQARGLRVKGVDAVIIPDGQTGPRLSALSLAVLIQQRTGIETVLQCSARDRSLLGLQSDLLGAHAMGIRNLVVVTGDVPLVADYPDATAIVDVDSIGLLNAVSRFNHGVDVGGQSIGAPTAFHVGVTVNPAADDLDREIRRFEYKLEAGADFVVTQAGVRCAIVRSCGARGSRRSGLPVLLGVRPLESVLDAEWMANEIPGAQVPDDVLERMRARAQPESAAAEGIAIAREVYQALKGRVQGVLVTAPLGRIDLCARDDSREARCKQGLSGPAGACIVPNGAARGPTRRVCCRKSSLPTANGAWTLSVHGQREPANGAVRTRKH